MQFSRVIVLILLAIFCLAGSSSVSRAQSAPDLPKCDCTRFAIDSSLATVKAGDAVEFEIVSEGPNVLSRKFSWTVSAGTIVSGQGTSKITVQTSADMLPKQTQFGPSAVGSGTVLLGNSRPSSTMTVVAKQIDQPNCTCEIFRFRFSLYSCRIAP